MTEAPNLLPEYEDAVIRCRVDAATLLADINALRLHSATVAGQHIDMVYAPFDYINQSARVVIVGMTPGHFQAVNALKAAQQALRDGHDVHVAAAKAKVCASFSGEPMRGNLVRMLDAIGLAKRLGLASTASLWAEAAGDVHFTSALRYPVFVDRRNWSGNPDMVRNPLLRRWLETYTGAELRQLKDALIIPLGPKVTAAMGHLATMGMIDAARLLSGLPHPSGANAERIASFLGQKPDHLCSAKTNPAALRAAREDLTAKVETARGAIRRSPAR